MTSASREQTAWAALAEVPDPELPALSLCDLGIVRAVRARGDDLEVVLTPTYSGCPATEFIQQSVREALARAGLDRVTVTQQLAPAWTTGWISAEGRRKLLEYGIAPPGRTGPVESAVLSFRPPRVSCPQCASNNTERLSAFGSTACKALHRCLDCREPFEHFKPL